MLLFPFILHFIEEVNLKFIKFHIRDIKVFMNFMKISDNINLIFVLPASVSVIRAKHLGKILFLMESNLTHIRL